MTADSQVRCLRCGREARVSLRLCLKDGWPECCGQTMLLVETPSKETIDAAVRGMCDPARRAMETL
jgi:hypothetical protein